MIGHIVAEERFLHQGIDHHLFVVQSEQIETEYRFEARRVAPGEDHAVTIYEKTVDFAARPDAASASSIEDLVQKEISTVRRIICSEEDLHAHDP